MAKIKEEKVNVKGKVKWFDPKKGYGFIIAEELGKEVYVHFTEIKQDGFRSLEKDELVTFDYNEEKNAAFNVEKEKSEN